METGTTTKYLKAKLFLEGVECPVMEVSVQGGVSSPAGASISVPYSARVHNLLPRTLAHTFFFESGITVEASGTTVRARPKDIDNLLDWKLLYVGEVVAYSYAKVGGQRQVKLQCSDPSSYWSSARIYWGSKNLSLLHFKQAMVMGATKVYKDRDSINPTALLDILMGRSSTLPNLSGVLGGLVGLLETVTGVYDKGYSKKYRGVNDFMSLAELRLHLTRMIGASEQDTSSAAFFDNMQGRNYLNRVISSMNQTSSYMDLVSVLMGKIYYEWASSPAPSFIKGDSELKVLTTKEVGTDWSKYPAVTQAMNLLVATNSYVANYLGEAAERNQGTGGDYVFYRNASAEESSERSPIEGGYWLAAPDAENHYKFKSFMGSSKGVLSVPGYDPVRGEGYGWYSQQVDIIKSKAEREATTPSRTAELAELYKGFHLADAAAVIAAQITSTYGRTSFSLTQFTVDRLRELLNALYAAIEALGKHVSRPTKEVITPKKAASRLHCFLFHPDLFMLPPPRCNVVFPDHIQSISFARSWLSEPTRLLMTGRTELGNELQQTYFSPNADILGTVTKETSERAALEGHAFLMAHEKFVGIIPMITGLGDEEIFRTLHKKSLAANKNDQASVAGEALYASNAHFQRAANYLFLSSRYASRTMDLTLKFSPQLVPGYPCLILDPVAASSDEELSAVFNEGTHFVGVIAGISHTISPEGAVTRVSLNKCRRHNEGADLFGTRVGTGIYGGRRVNIKKGGSKLPGDYWIKVKNDPTFATESVATTESEDFAAVIRRSGGAYDDSGKTEYSFDYVTSKNSDGEYVYTKKTEGGERYVKVDVSKRTTNKEDKDVQFTFEATARPPWLADIFRPSNISEYYKSMLGCSSVIAATGISTDGIVKYVDQNGEEREIAKEFTLASATTEAAAESLANGYMAIKNAGGSVDSFIAQYTHRDIATYIDIFGTEGVDGIEGFHENAFASVFSQMQEEFTGGIPLEPLSGIDPNSKKATIDYALDPRLERRQGVEDYVRSLSRIRAT